MTRRGGVFAVSNHMANILNSVVTHPIYQNLKYDKRQFVGRVTTVLWMTTVAPPTRAGATLPSPAGKVDRRIAETDEEVTNPQITRLLEGFVERLVSAKM